MQPANILVGLGINTVWLKLAQLADDVYITCHGISVSATLWCCIRIDTTLPWWHIPTGLLVYDYMMHHTNSRLVEITDHLSYENFFTLKLVTCLGPNQLKFLKILVQSKIGLVGKEGMIFPQPCQQQKFLCRIHRQIWVFTGCICHMTGFLKM